MLAAARAVHFGAVLLLFGGFTFLLCVLRPALRATEAAAEADALHRWLMRIAGASVVVAIVSAALWLALAAAQMSGLPWQEAWRRNVLTAVLGETRFGDVLMVRFAIALALGVVIAWAWHSPGPRHRGRAIALAELLSAVLLATLALVGHAAAWPAASGIVVAADALHLLAAGAWIGALPAFVLLLKRSLRGMAGLSMAAVSARRMSMLGMVSVACLVVTGLIGSWYLVGGVAALLGTSYGRLLAVKLGLFALVLALAVANQRRWTPLLESACATANMSDAQAASRRLTRNTIGETILACTIVLCVGALGTLSPAAHEPIVWPLPYALSWPEPGDLSGLRIALCAAAIIAGAVLIVAVRARGVGNASVAAIGIGAVTAVAAVLCAVPAYPTTFAHSPARYTATSIARGSALYSQHCAACHGANGYGDGPAAAALPAAPPPLTKRLFDRREGDLFWWVSNGIAGTAMPGFAASIVDSERWDIINFLLAGADAEGAKTMNGSVEPWRGTVAPDFTFEMERGAQETLMQQRGRSNVLLILFSYPESMPRLCVLAHAKDRLYRGGIRMLAVPMSRRAMTGVAASADLRCLSPLIAAGPDSDIVTAYTLFRRIPPRVVPPVAAHSEFLIDRQGYLRARWIAQQPYAWDGVDDLLRQTDSMDRSESRPAAPETPAAGSDLH